MEECFWKGCCQHQVNSSALRAKVRRVVAINRRGVHCQCSEEVHDTCRAETLPGTTTEMSFFKSNTATNL